MRKTKEIVAFALIALVLLTLTSSVNAIALREYFSFASTTFNSDNSCPSLSYSQECSGSTTGYITAKGLATGSGFIEGFTPAANLVSIYWTYSSGKYVNACPSTLTIKGKVTYVTGPAPVTVGSAISVTLTGGDWSSGGMSITAGTYTATLAGIASLYCPV